MMTIEATLEARDSNLEAAKAMKRYILFDHDGVLVDTEFWYYKAAERALGDIGIVLDKQQYLRDMTQGLGSWVQAKQAGIDEQVLSTRRAARDAYYQEYLRTEDIEIEGVVDTLAELSRYARMAIVTTAKRADFERLVRSHFAEHPAFVNEKWVMLAEMSHERA